MNPVAGLEPEMEAQAIDSRHGGFQRSLKLTSMVAITGTGLPSFMPGLNFHLSTASMAF